MYPRTSLSGRGGRRSLVDPRVPGLVLLGKEERIECRWGKYFVFDGVNVMQVDCLPFSLLFPFDSILVFLFFFGSSLNVTLFFLRWSVRRRLLLAGLTTVLAVRLGGLAWDGMVGVGSLLGCGRRVDIRL